MLVPETKRAILFRLIFYAAAGAFIVVVWQMQRSYLDNWIAPATAAVGSMPDRELDALLQMNQLVTTLSTGLLGAIGFLLINIRKANRRFESLWAACASALCVGLSLFFGYLVYQWIIAMLKVQIFDPDLKPLLWARNAHFYLFLLAVLLFGDFAFNSLRGEDGHGEKQGATGD